MWPWAGSIKRHFLVAGSPVDLAIVRVVFFAVALPAAFSSTPREMADLPDELITMPSGAAWIYRLVPPNEALARGGAIVMALAAVAAMIGWRARPAAAIWAVTATWVLGIPNLFGKVDHSQHLLWFAFLLAASPCADVLSLDALRRGSPSVAPHVRYGFPIRVWWLVLGFVYLFPGLGKVASQGLGWASPGNLRPILHGQWAAVAGYEPIARLDNWPIALVAMGLFTIVFELGFVLAVFSRFRMAALVAGVAFHVGTYVVLDISFGSLIVSYVALVPWAATLGTGPGRLPAPEPIGSGGHADRSTRAIAAILVLGCAGYGFTQTTEGWPFACNPTFTGRFADTHTVLEFERVADDGTVTVSSQDDVFAWIPQSIRQRIAGQFLGLSPAERQEVLREIELPEALRGASIRVVQKTVTNDPDHSVVVSSELLAEVDLP